MCDSLLHLPDRVRPVESIQRAQQTPCTPGILSFHPHSPRAMYSPRQSAPSPLDMALGASAKRLRARQRISYRGYTSRHARSSRFTHNATVRMLKSPPAYEDRYCPVSFVWFLWSSNKTNPIGRMNQTHDGRRGRPFNQPSRMLPSRPPRLSRLSRIVRLRPKHCRLQEGLLMGPAGQQLHARECRSGGFQNVEP